MSDMYTKFLEQLKSRLKTTDISIARMEAYMQKLIDCRNELLEQIRELERNAIE